MRQGVKSGIYFVGTASKETRDIITSFERGEKIPGQPNFNLIQPGTKTQIKYEPRK